ncbi:amidohydrolase family protein [Brevundimonas sp. 2R-24]|uniref:Amidohydrolase family protein n=1 Tax=Peiella sedimenti TaxID=3061083 RepID=A0ABT8SQC2_9CAUL|nr:amidohydrolase family protein [Caulobacteraceae bacterium XZ-24]
MKRPIPSLSAALAGVALFLTGCASIPRPRVDLILTHASVVSPETGEVRRDMAIAIRNGRILAVGPEARGFDGVQVVDVRGAYVAPGLTDAHVHLGNDAFAALIGGVVPTAEDRTRALEAYLAEGITSLVVLNGGPDLLRLRDAIEQGEILGPRLVIASPFISGAQPILPPPVARLLPGPDHAQTLAAELRGQGYDLIKTREDLTPQEAMAMSLASDGAGLPMLGHLPRSARETGQFFAAPGTGAAHLYDLLQLTQAREADFAGLAADLRRRRALVVTTLSVHQNILAKNADFAATLAAPCAGRLDPQMYALWTGMTFEPSSDSETITRQMAEQGRLLRALVDAGVPVLAGTDAGAPTITPGCSMASELELMVQGGLTAGEALTAATAAPADVFERLRGGGRIAPGAPADLILMARNPLEAISAVRTPIGVVRGGVYLDLAALEAMRARAMFRGR